MIRGALLFHLYSGHLFFTAVAMFVLGMAGGRRTRLLPPLAIGLGLLSTTPMPLGLAMPLLILAVAAAFLNEQGWGRSLRSAGGLAGAAVKASALVLAVAAAIYEFRHHTFHAQIARPYRLMVIGDSLSSGGPGEPLPWPQRLRAPGVANLARPSDTAADAARDQLPRLPPAGPNDVVIVEIGGNDMLEGRPAREFEQALDAIVRGAKPRKTIVLELPLLPGRWAYGAAQRRVARRHGAILIPKRLLARALADPLSTTDHLHLNARGHEQIARGLAHMLRWD